MNKPVYLDLSILLELSRIVNHEFWYDYINLEYKDTDVIWIQTVI